MRTLLSISGLVIGSRLATVQRGHHWRYRGRGFWVLENIAVSPIMTSLKSKSVVSAVMALLCVGAILPPVMTLAVIQRTHHRQ
jgi:hypothetical protein